MQCLKLIAQHDPLPLLSMRTTIEALVHWPDLAPFIMEMLIHLIGAHHPYGPSSLRPSSLRPIIPMAHHPCGPSSLGPSSPGPLSTGPSSHLPDSPSMGGTRASGRGIWNSAPLWTGFIKCCLRPEALPHSLAVLLALPKTQLLEVVGQQPNLREHLTSYAATHLGEVPQEALDALGLAPDEEAEDLF